jgi:hypothetical protein
MLILCNDCDRYVDRREIARSVHGNATACMSGRNRCIDCWLNRYRANNMDCCGINKCQSWLRFLFSGLSINEVQQRGRITSPLFINRLNYVALNNVQGGIDRPYEPLSVDRDTRTRQEQKMVVDSDDEYDGLDDDRLDGFGDSDIELEQPVRLPNRSPQLHRQPRSPPRQSLRPPQLPNHGLDRRLHPFAGPDGHPYR